jgi:hypothetical protein
MLDLIDCLFTIIGNLVLLELGGPMRRRNIDVREALDLLSAYLQARGERRAFIACGGAALILQGAVRQGRTTTDVDVVGPELDEAAELTRAMDGNPAWPKYVQVQLAEVKKAVSGGA